MASENATTGGRTSTCGADSRWDVPAGECTVRVAVRILFWRDLEIDDQDRIADLAAAGRDRTLHTPTLGASGV